MKLYTTKEVSEMLKLHPTTLSWLVQQGKVKPLRVGRQYRWTEDNIQKLLGINNSVSEDKTDNNLCTIYARVSGNLDKDLQNQISFLKEFALKNGLKIHDIISDKASSFNFKRKGLQKLLRSVFNREVKHVVVYSKDRLSRIAFDLFEELFKLFDVDIIVVDTSEKVIEEWQQKDIIDELISFLHYITSKMYGMRSYKQKIKELENAIQNSNNIQKQ